MNDFATANLHNNKNIIHVEADRILGQKIAGENFRHMVFNKLAPSVAAI